VVRSRFEAFGSICGLSLAQVRTPVNRRGQALIPG
jgi:hypothetical protein